MLYFKAPSATSQDEEQSTSSATHVSTNAVWSWGWRPIYYLYFSPARLFRWVCVHLCLWVWVRVCIPAKHFADSYNVIINVCLWCFTTKNPVYTNVCILMPLCSPLVLPGAELPTEDEPLSTDSANWPSLLQTQLVSRGPNQIPSDFVFPRNDSDGRSCHHQYLGGFKVCHFSKLWSRLDITKTLWVVIICCIIVFYFCIIQKRLGTTGLTFLLCLIIAYVLSFSYGSCLCRNDAELHQMMLS